MTTSLLQPQKLPPANDGHVRDSLTADERLLRKAVQRVLRAQVAEVHGRVEGGAKANAVPEKITKWDQEVMKEVRPIWFGLFKKGGDKALRNIRRFPKHARKMAVLSWAEMQASERVEVKSLKATPSIVIPEWIEDPDVLTALENEMFKFARSINQTTADDLRAELMAGMENGETISQLADRISGLSDEWVEGWRSEMIARTETARAFSTGHIEAWRSTGVVSRVVWTAAGDACPFCQQMDGTVIELGENFFDQGEEQTVAWKGQEIVMGHDYSDVNGPPLHPNCIVYEDTPITTFSGMKKIKDMKEGDVVLTHRGFFQKVLKVFKHEYTGKVVKIRFGGVDWLTVTEDHPVLVDSKWKCAKDIVVGDKVTVAKSQGFKIVPVLGVDHGQVKQRVVYNLSVAEDESYIAKGMVVHNCRCVLVAELKEEGE